MIPAGHWKIVGTDFSSLSPLSPLAPQLIQFCFSMGSTEWCQLLSAMFISVSPPSSTVLSCTTFCSTKMPLDLPEWYHCSAETQQGPAVCRAWHPFNDSGTGSEANDFGIIQNHLHKKKIIVITVSTVFIYVRACHPHGYLFRTPKSLLDGPCGGPNTHRKALGEPCCLGVWVGNQCFASWPWDRSGLFSLHSLLEQSIPVELLSVASRALIASYDFTQFEAQFTVIFI